MRCVPVLALVVACAGCFRGGFAPPPAAQDAAAPPDQAPVPDQPRPDLALASVNEPCKPPACRPGLTCTWKESTRFCRPPCRFDAGACPDAMACGRPTLGTKSADPTAPRVCMPTAGSAKVYQSCKYLPCSQGLMCLNGALGRVCVKVCTAAGDCGAAEDCMGTTTKGNKICLPRCTSDAQCKAPMVCAGIGDEGLDHCLPSGAAKLGQDCTATGLCAAKLRCLGWSGQQRRCHKVCNTVADCGGGGGQVCVNAHKDASLCAGKCGLFDKPVKCASHEVCFASSTAKATFCLPAKGAADNCGSAPCVSGKLCVGGKCRLACDATHTCPVIMKCSKLNSGGAPLPWRACLPL